MIAPEVTGTAEVAVYVGETGGYLARCVSGSFAGWSTCPPGEVS